MKIFQGQYDLSRIESYILFTQGDLFIHMLGQILSLAVFQAQVYVVRSLKCEVQSDDKGMLYLLQNIDLGNYKLCLLT